MQKKSLETILYSSVGIVVMLVILIAVNVIVGAKPLRVDMTQNKLYTLSAGSKAILGKIKQPVKIRFYCSQGDTATPATVYLKDYARKVQDLLDEYQEVAGSKLVIQKFDPEPDSDAEDSARLDGLQPRQLPGVDPFYLGISVSQGDHHSTIPFLSPNKEKLLEYDISRAISQVINPVKPIVGVMSALPVFGSPGNPMMRRMGRQGSSPWTFVQQLQQDYNVKRVALTTTKIPKDIKVLVVIYPKGISDKAEYAIDQFVLRGGKLVAFLDPYSVYSSHQQSAMMGQAPANSASLGKLLNAWGLTFNTNKVVADLDFKLQLQNQNGQPMEEPAWLGLTSEGINQKDIVTSEIDSVWLPLCGTFAGKPVKGLKETVLLHSSKDAELANAFMANMGGQSLLSNFKPTGVKYPLAVRLTGKFKTAFPNGEPGQSGTNATAKAGTSLTESKAVNSVVLVGDSDLLADQFALRKEDTPFGELVSQMNGNLDFAQNVVEQLAGSQDLIGIRSRAAMRRPFTRINKMEAAAEAQGEAKIQQLQQSLQQTEEKLSQLQEQKKNASQRYILSPEQQTEIANFQKKQAQVSHELREARKDLRKEVVSLETRLEWWNILAMPLAVTLVGIMIAVVKRRKNSAK